VRELVEVAPGVHVATADMWQTTSTVVVADDGACLVVDPAVTVADVLGLAETVEVHGWHVVAGFATHPHWDHVLWAARLGGAPRWATPTACRVARERREEILREADTDAPGHDHVLTGRLTALPDASGDLPWSGPAAVVVPHDAHSPGSAMLLLPEHGVLCAGDLVSDREVPLIDLDAPDPVGDHLAALSLVEDLLDAHEVRAVVPGHGTVTDADGARARVAADRAYLTTLRGGDVSDPRLADPWVAGEHERQVTWARARRSALA